MVEFKPTTQICQHLCAFHFYAHDLSRQVEAHHYCSKGEKDGVMFQCIIYDDDAPSAKLIGVEYIISRETYASLDSDEQKLWHSHAYEVQSGMLYDPRGDSRADLPHMEALMTAYGKTWHTWQVDLGHKVPLGPPQLMMAFTKDGQLSPGLLASRDERYDRKTGDVKTARSHLKLMESVHPAANDWETGNGEVMQVQCGRTPFKG